MLLPSFEILRFKVSKYFSSDCLYVFHSSNAFMRSYQVPSKMKILPIPQNLMSYARVIKGRNLSPSKCAYAL